MGGSCGKRGETGSQSNGDSQATTTQRDRPRPSAPKVVAEQAEDPVWLLSSPGPS